VAEFLAMGGYGAYVWAAFGFTLVTMIGLLWQSWSWARKREAEAERLRLARRERRDPAVRRIVARRDEPTPRVEAAGDRP
jgi:heme exporter protein D